MIYPLIEQKRLEMYKSYFEDKDLDHTVQISQQLDELLNLYNYSQTYIAYDNNAKVHKNAILNIRDVIFTKEPYYISLLEEHSVAYENTSWYDLENLYNLLSKIQKQNKNSILESIGMGVPKKCLFPQNIESFEQGIFIIDKAFQMNHINGSIGSYKSTKIDSQTILLVCNTPAYPTEFNYGVIKGLAVNFNENISITSEKTLNGGNFKIKIRNP